MSGECQVNVKSQSELDIGGRENCCTIHAQYFALSNLNLKASFSLLLILLGYLGIIRVGTVNIKQRSSSSRHQPLH